MTMTKFHPNQGRGLRGFDVAALKQQPAKTCDLRRFGTELSSNLNAGNKNNVLPNRRKRTFKEVLLTSEQENKEEEEFNPAKRSRYNLRSHAYKINPSEKIFGDKLEANNKLMSVGSDGCEEDIDLVQKTQTKLSVSDSVTSSAAAAAAVEEPETANATTRAEKAKKVNPRLRRSARLAKKRLNKQDVAQRPVVEPFQCIEEPVLMECDEAHTQDELFVADYAQDILTWYRECEQSSFQKSLIKSDYISSSFQSDLNDSMRSILLNWIIQVHRKFKLSDRALYLGIYIFDAYLSLVPIRRKQLQLIGCCSVWIASKYHEIYAPEANDFAYYSAYTFKVADLFQTEIDVLCKLKFKFTCIMTPLHFLQRFLQFALHPISKKYKDRGTAEARRDCKRYCDLLTHLSGYFNDLSLIDCKLISTEKPSIIAAASLCFAILSISLYPKWPHFLSENTGYSYAQLKPIIVRLNECRLNSERAKLVSIRKRHPSIHQWLDRLNIDAAVNNSGKH